MKKLGLGTMALYVALAAAAAQGSVIITEIMYNPAGPDGVTPPEPIGEWVEIYNSGDQAMDVSGWKLDDEDSGAFGAIADGSMLLPGEVAVIANKAAEFNQSWGMGIKVFETAWQSLANSASATNEVLVLLDGTDALVDMANYEAGTNDWPTSTNGRSIYLKDVSLDNDLGINWGKSEVGVDGAYSPANPVSPYHANDVGSPGYVVPEPATLILMLGFGLGLARRRVAR